MCISIELVDSHVSWIFVRLWMAMWIMVISGCGWLAPFPLPLAAPARVSRGEARPSSPLPCRVPHTRLGRRSRPLSWGRHPSRVGAERGKGGRKKWRKGPEKKTRFFGGRAACSRLLGPLRVPPLAIRVPPTHAEPTTLGGHPTCSACTLGPEGYMLPRGP